MGPTRNPLGVIHLDTDNPRQPFEQQDLEVLVAVATVAGQAVEYANMHSDLLELDRQKHELDTAILKRARLFADYPQQSIVIGEFQHAYKDGLIKSADGICALGLVTLGKSPGRSSDTEITVFDSSGIAIQDLNVAGAIFEAAQQMNEIQYVDF